MRPIDRIRESHLLIIKLLVEKKSFDISVRAFGMTIRASEFIQDVVAKAGFTKNVTAILNYRHFMLFQIKIPKKM